VKTITSRSIVARLPVISRRATIAFIQGVLTPI
jgi:hypothetical protein